ncbi:MAG: hypothetical protein U0Q16_22410 [Bryobacteraceae bacterium]
MNRRQFLAVSAVAAQAKQEPFRHRGYLGWITDLATREEAHVAWPSMRLDADLLADYRRGFDMMKELGLDELCVWGLYVSRSWPVDIASAVPRDRGKLVERLIADAHRRGIRVLSGLGIYSWGFDQILKANPKLSRGNANAMCGTEPESWEWMRRVIDFVFERFPIDGVSMQSADQGRCPCDRCKRIPEIEYHAELNIRCADYVRSKWPKKTIGVSGWGMRFEDPASLPSLTRLSSRIDYLIDVRDSSRRRNPEHRKRVIESLQCDFGTLGGPQVEPPQHYARDRWFLPTLRRVGEHLGALHADGGRACEWFYHILANPGDEVSTWLAAKMLRDPATPWRKHLTDSVERVFGASKTSTRDALSEALLAAEDAYFRHIPPLCGTISMEPLVSDHAGEPVYLTKRLNADQRRQYFDDLTRVGTTLRKLVPDVKQKRKMEFCVRAIDNVVATKV